MAVLHVLGKKHWLLGPIIFKAGRKCKNKIKYIKSKNKGVNMVSRLALRFKDFLEIHQR